MTYRNDIDGLRAIAVIAVVLYHAHVAPFGGGYVGVDIFFVISGYLITGILRPEMSAGNLSLRDFYERRIRRIFPALFAVIAACFAAGWVLFFPTLFDALAKSALATILFASNFYFRAQSADYFFQPSDTSPLLHTWSLAVEEQFYIVYPLGLLFAFRAFKRKAPVLVLAAMAASFIMCAWAMHSHPKGAFYLAPARAWEFLIGAAIALDVLPLPKAPWLREILAASGLALICSPIVTYTSATPFPGWTAIAPCAGTALIIWAGEGKRSRIGKLLEFKPLVWTGWISYSLYLWHWPIFVFCRQYFTRLDGLILFLAIVSTAVISLASWFFIERPFRNRSFLGKRQVFLLAAASSAMAGVAGLWVIVGDGLPGRIPPAVAQIALGSTDRDPRLIPCLEFDPSEAIDQQKCGLGPRSLNPTYVLWGDSHAGALMPALEQAAEPFAIAGVFVGHSTCPPLAGIDLIKGSETGSCRDVNERALSYILETRSIDTVFLAARWALYTETTRYLGETGERVFLTDERSEPLTREESRRVFVRSLEATIRTIEETGRHVVLIGPVPEIGWDVPKTLAMRGLAGGNIPPLPTQDDFMHRQAFILDEANKLAGRLDLDIVYPSRPLCRTGICIVTDRSNALYFDDDHLSTYGARWIAPTFSPAMKNIAQRIREAHEAKAPLHATDGAHL